MRRLLGVASQRHTHTVTLSLQIVACTFTVTITHICLLARATINPFASKRGLSRDLRNFHFNLNNFLFLINNTLPFPSIIKNVRCDVCEVTLSTNRLEQ